MIVYENPWFEVRKEGNFHFVHEPAAINAAAIVPLIGEGILLLEMQRPSQNGETTLEIPRGYGEKGETPLECALRELKEETGLEAAAEAVTLLGQVRPNTGILTTRVALFSVKFDAEIALGDRGPEAKNVMKVPLSRLPQLLADGHIEDSFTLAALAYLYSSAQGLR